MGSILILCGTVGFGNYLTQQERRHLEILCELKRVLICMCGDLEYGRFPMCELLKNAQDCVTDAVKNCFCEIEEKLKKQSEDCVYTVWHDVWEKHARELLLQEQELKIIQQAGQKLGSMELQQQIELLRFGQQQLEEKIAQLSKEQKETEKLYRSLSLLAGLFLVVLLF